MLRALWEVCYVLLFRLSPVRCYGFRRGLLRIFGAKIQGCTGIRRNVKIKHPWKLEVGDCSMIGDNVRIYNLGMVKIGSHTVISQDVHLCAGTHDFRDPKLSLDRSTIEIGDGVWVCADAFVGPNVRVGHNVVVGARAVVVKDVDENVVVGGNPAKVIGKRIEKTSQRETAKQEGNG